MSKKAKEDATFPLYVFGLDETGKPRGARFSEVKDEVVTAALDMGCWIVFPAPPEFVPHGMQLPVGRLYASGKAFIPPIRRALHDKLLATKGDNARRLPREAGNESAEPPAAQQMPVPDVPCISPVAPCLPRGWEEIGVGHMVLVHQSAEDGWWEAVVLKREDEILTLRYRDYPKLPQMIRHVHAVALVNPGPAQGQT